MKISKEKRIILLAVLTGVIFAFRIVQVIQEVEDMAEAIEAKPEEKQPGWLRSRYKPAVEREKTA